MRYATDFDELYASEYRIKSLGFRSFSDSRSFQHKYEKAAIQMAGTYIYFQFMYIITDWLFISIIPHLTPKNPDNENEGNAN